MESKELLSSFIFSHEESHQWILHTLRANTSSSLAPTSRMSSFTTSKHFIFPRSYLLHVLLHHIQTLHLPSLLPPACPPSSHPNTSSSLAPTSCMSSFTTSKHFIFPLSYLPHVLLHHIQTLHLPSLLPPACPPSPHPNTSSLAPTSRMSSFTTSKHFIFPRSYLPHVLLHHIQTLHLPSLLPPACPPSPHPNTPSSLSPTSCMSSFTTSKQCIFPRSYIPHVLLHHIQTMHLPSLLPPACPPSPHPNNASSLSPTSCMSSFAISKHFIFPRSYLLHVLLHHIQTLHLPSLLPPACPPSPHPNTSSSLAPTSYMSSFTTSKHFIFPLSYLLHVLLRHIQTLHLPSLLPPACPPSPHPNTSSSLSPTSCMSSFTTSKHFIFPLSYLLHVLLHHIQTLHLPSLLPPACPPSPHPNTSSSLSPTSCMSSFTTSKHFIFSLSYLLHVLLRHIQTLHLPSLLPPACPPSPHPNTSSSLSPTSCMSSFTTSKHFNFPRSYLPHVLLRQIKIPHLWSSPFSFPDNCISITFLSTQSSSRRFTRPYHLSLDCLTFCPHSHHPGVSHDRTISGLTVWPSVHTVIIPAFHTTVPSQPWLSDFLSTQSSPRCFTWPYHLSLDCLTFCPNLSINVPLMCSFLILSFLWENISRKKNYIYLPAHKWYILCTRKWGIRVQVEWMFDTPINCFMDVHCI